MDWIKDTAASLCPCADPEPVAGPQGEADFSPHQLRAERALKAQGMGDGSNNGGH